MHRHNSEALHGPATAVSDLPFGANVETIQTFSSAEVEVPDFPPSQHELERVPARITRFENDRDR